MSVREVSSPISPLCVPVNLDRVFNARCGEQSGSLSTPSAFMQHHGLVPIRGMPFRFGERNARNVVVLDREPVEIPLHGTTAPYLVFVHVAADADQSHGDGLEDTRGAQVGAIVSSYQLEFVDGWGPRTPIRRRIEIQQARCGVEIAPMACVPAIDDAVFPAADEAQLLGRPVVEPDLLAEAVAKGGDTRVVAAEFYGYRQQRRCEAALIRAARGPDPGLLWLYALTNDQPTRPIARLLCWPGPERSAIYAVTVANVFEHPLRPGLRRKARLRLPDELSMTSAGTVDDIQIDLGTIISARRALDYDVLRWSGDEPVVEPSPNERDVIIEYAAHEQARLHVGGTVYDFAGEFATVTTIAPADRPVRLRFLDAESGQPVAVRVHLHGQAGEYLPPRGHHRLVSRIWGHDYAAEFVNVENQYAYVDGECIVDLPLGTVYAEITRGFEIAPIRCALDIAPDTTELKFELHRVLDWRMRGWVTADTHVHFLSPQTALLEGRAECVNVVNLLASQWGEMFSNVGDFDGRTNVGETRPGEGGEFLVRVGSENRMQVLGHISLLGYSGSLIQPLCSGGPGEAAIGDPVDVTLADWAKRCIDQGGLTVLPHAPILQFEGAADIVLGLIDALELMTPNPLHADQIQLNSYGLADWYRYLNLGYHVPLVGGSDKMSAAMLLGGIRTYAKLRSPILTYEAWMDAIRTGNTFVTVGPLAALSVEGVEPGGTLQIFSDGGVVQVEWEVESSRMAIERVEVVVGGLIADEVAVGRRMSAYGHAAIRISESTWIALRVRASNRGMPDDVAAHTSAVFVRVDGSESIAAVDAVAILDQIQGALSFFDTIAPRRDVRRLRALRATFETAYNCVHNRMHAAGIYHAHPQDHLAADT
jgi:hypothetical protein